MPSRPISRLNTAKNQQTWTQARRNHPNCNTKRKREEETNPKRRASSSCGASSDGLNHVWLDWRGGNKAGGIFEERGQWFSKIFKDLKLQIQEVPRTLRSMNNKQNVQIAEKKRWNLEGNQREGKKTSRTEQRGELLTSHQKLRKS